jgi:hypothetical protein
MNTLTTAEAINQVRTILKKRYPNFNSKGSAERLVLAMSVLANDIKVREIGGNNKGPWVGAILGSVGLDQGYSWCAASVDFCANAAGIKGAGPSTNAGQGRVKGWREWAVKAGRLHDEPKAGRLATLMHDANSGHIEGVAEVFSNGSQRTYGGNTSSGEKGSQSDGGGFYMRTRPKGYFSKFIDMSGLECVDI